MQRRVRHSSETQQILIGGAVGLLVLMIAVGIVAALVPYEVDLRADIREADGEIQLVDRFGHEDDLMVENPSGLLPGDTVAVEAGGSLNLEIVDDSQAYAYLVGPVDWKLVTAWRFATMTEHVREIGQEFRLIVEQSGAGTVIYDLSNADPSVEELEFVLRLPDGEFTPQTPCFQVTAPGEETPSTVLDIACPSGEVMPSPEPTLPSLP